MHSTSFDHAINCVLVSPLLIDNFRRKYCGLTKLGRVRLARRDEIARGWWLPNGKTPRDQAAHRGGQPPDQKNTPPLPKRDSRIDGTIHAHRSSKEAQRVPAPRAWPIRLPSRKVGQTKRGAESLIGYPSEESYAGSHPQYPDDLRGRVRIGSQRGR
jgi:hypothetical protein